MVKCILRRTILAWHFISDLRVLVIALFLVSLTPTAHGDDSILDAHRQEIADLMHKDKYPQAAALSKDLLKGDPTHYQDHLALARAEDHLNSAAAALAEYQAVIDLVPPVPQNDDQRSALAEAKRRIHVLDPTAEKLQSAVADFDKKLQALERSARESHDKVGLENVLQVRQQLTGLDTGRCHVLLDLSAKTDWLDTGMNVVAGQKYQAVASGTWGYYGYPRGSCDADGTQGVMLNGFNQGALLGVIDGTPPFLIGKNGTFVPPSSGRLKLAINDNENGGRSDNWGTQRVYIGRLPPEEVK